MILQLGTLEIVSASEVVEVFTIVAKRRVDEAGEKIRMDRSKGVQLHHIRHCPNVLTLNYQLSTLN